MLLDQILQTLENVLMVGWTEGICNLFKQTSLFLGGSPPSIFLDNRQLHKFRFSAFIRSPISVIPSRIRSILDFLGAHRDSGLHFSLTTMKTPLLLICLLLTALFTPLRAEPAAEAAQKLAEAYGLKAFPAVKEIQFTFHAQLPDKKVERSWIWRPQLDEVTAVDSKTTYKRNSMTEADTKLDAQFINDQYWLLFPLHLVWDEAITFTLAEEKVPGPISGDDFRKLTVKYGDVGYTPGDAYDLYFDDQYQVREWAYRKGGVKEPTRISTWEDYENFEGLKISTNHEGPEKFRVWFTGIEVTQ